MVKTPDAETIMVEADKWLIGIGVVTPTAHNNIILNLYMTTNAKYVEYYMDQEARKIHIVLHLSLWRGLISNKLKLINDTIELIKQYLTEYDVLVSLKRYKKKPTK